MRIIAARQVLSCLSLCHSIVSSQSCPQLLCEYVTFDSHSLGACIAAFLLSSLVQYIDPFFVIWTLCAVIY